MAKVLQHRRGTAAEHSNFTGAAGEITFDTTDKRLVAHDGTTKGGIPMAKKSEVDAIDVGVTSFNGSKGAVTYSAPVSSVNGQTGAVSVDVGVTSFNGSKGAVTYSAPVSSVNGKTGAVTGLVTSVNGTSADASGNVTISVSPTATPNIIFAWFKNGRGYCSGGTISGADNDVWTLPSGGTWRYLAIGSASYSDGGTKSGGSTITVGGPIVAVRIA